MENLSKVITSGNVSVGGKMANQFIADVTKDCKDVKNDDKYTNLMRMTHQ